MPEHVHLIVWPERSDSEISPLLKAIKQPFSNRIRKLLEECSSPLLAKLTVQERPGKQAFRFWLDGGGFDRNYIEQKTVLAAIDYLHMNPVRRRLVKHPGDWKWSSYRFYQADGIGNFPQIPKITPLPAAFWDP